MSEQATFEPTAKRLAEARRSGLVAQSPELRAALALAATFGALVALGPSMVRQVTAYFAIALARAAVRGGAGEAGALALDSGLHLLAVPLAVTLAGGFAQTGGLWVGPPRAELARLSPAAAWRRFSGARAFGTSLESILKVAALALVAAVTVGALLPRLLGLAGAPAPRVLDAFGGAARRLGLRLAATALLIGVIDAALAHRRHRRALRMTRRELERERRELEGDPRQRAERRRLYAELTVGDAIGDVRRADLAVTAGDAHGDDGGEAAAAVALRYQRGRDRAPIIVAVGRRQAAARIASQARAAGVPLFGDAVLARALCDLQPGAEIPEETYDRVAELLRDTLALTHGASDRRA